MAGMQPPNVHAMGGVPQSLPQGMPGQQAPQPQVQQQPGAPQQQQQQQQQVAHPPPQAPHPDQHDTIIRQVKVTVVHLKESLRNLMKIAAHAFSQSAAIDNTSKLPDETAARFDKSMEEFCSLCDQLELYLKLAQDCSTQYMEGERYTQVPLMHVHKPEMVPAEGLTTGQYISTVRAQIQCAAEVHSSLMECCQKLTHISQT